MSTVVEEIEAVLRGLEVEEEDALQYGMPKRSGRYPYGSGEDPYQHGRDFLGRVEELRKQNFKFTDDKGVTWTGDTAIAKSMGLTTTQFRTELGIAKDERRMLKVARAKALKEDGLNPTEIGREMGVNESTVRSWFDEKSESRMQQARETAEFLKQRVDEKGMVDVGRSAEIYLNVSKEKLQQALYLLEREGYEVHGGRIPQATNPNQMTTQKVLCVPGTPHKAIFEYDKVADLEDFTSRDGGKTFVKFQYPESMDSKRLMIRYAEDGGLERDGIVELRRGVADLSLGDAKYSQVRILVDKSKYIKGMAVYSDNLPDGVDVVFNTNKTKDVPMGKVLKDIKEDPDNPFGSLIGPKGQSTYIDKDGNEKLSLINKRADQGDWSDWADALPSQFLSKQSKTLAKKQLDIAKMDKLAEYDEICSLTNPTLKKHLLQKFSDECDSAAVHLKAAALPGQKYHVIIPINTMKDDEVYAPGYENGTKLALIRYPHGGTFEIPILTVNNKNVDGKKWIGNDSIDAVGITKKVADQLSGADFDGDTVMCIPTHNGNVKITSRQPLKELEGFDPKDAYPEREGMKYMKDPKTGKDSTQREMGMISNLITDMTLGGAKDDELAAAVRHSMVVIDAGKHKLDYKQSELDNNIAALKKKYQPKYDEDGNVVGGGGASTIISRASREKSVLKRQGTPKINTPGKEWYDPTKPEGALIYKVADDVEYQITTTNKRTGVTTTKTKYRTQQSTEMAETDDAYTLVSSGRHAMELLYADYANSMKALGNQARKELTQTGKIAYDASAAKVYKDEVRSLEEKVNNAEINKLRERSAQRKAAAEVSSKQKAAEEAGQKMSKGDVKKARQQAISKYRDEVGSVSRKDRSVKITDREWEAIQAGAISETKLKKILDNTDIDDLRARATPKTTTSLSTAKVNRIKTMSASGKTIQEIASSLGVSTSTVANYLKGSE